MVSKGVQLKTVKIHKRGLTSKTGTSIRSNTISVVGATSRGRTTACRDTKPSIGVEASDFFTLILVKILKVEEGEQRDFAYQLQ
jgi:hypothetical protein